MSEHHHAYGSDACPHPDCVGTPDPRDATITQFRADVEREKEFLEKALTKCGRIAGLEGVDPCITDRQEITDCIHAAVSAVAIRAESAESRATALEADLNRSRAALEAERKENDRIGVELMAAEAENARLREALKPFAEFDLEKHSWVVFIQDHRVAFDRARALAAPAPEGEKVTTRHAAC